MTSREDNPGSGEPATLAVMLTEAPSSDLRGAAARRLLRAAADANHRLLPVFFYGDAVAVPHAPTACAAWRTLGDALGLRLAVCPAASERRGFATAFASGAERFEVLGLPAWLDLALGADRIVRL